MTLPAATVALDCMVTAPAVSPAPVMALVAAACVSPTTLGIEIVVPPPGELPPPPPQAAKAPKNPARAYRCINLFTWPMLMMTLVPLNVALLSNIGWRRGGPAVQRSGPHFPRQSCV